MSRWHHGHSILVGVLLGALLTRHLLWDVTVALALGVALGRSWAALRALLRRGLPVIEGQWRRTR